LTTLPSGTRWKYSRGPTPSGSAHANHEARSSADASSADGGTTYPSTSHQNRPTRSGCAQSKVT
jgi:hypothetical protein